MSERFEASPPSDEPRDESGWDVRFMREALGEAAKGRPSPNPHVGAVVVDPQTRTIVGRGHHPQRGREHAEVMALADAGPRARGATLYVTLEPCNHHGRTPPCTEAVLRSGVSRVVVGVRDPNPFVRGRGNERLREAGLAVTEGVLGEACEDRIAPWSKFLRTGHPWVRLKLATSLDGRIAAAPPMQAALRGDQPAGDGLPAPRGISRWITGDAARRRVHVLRRAVDAVMVGIGTALADDPELTARDAPALEGRTQPVRIVVDGRARLPLDAKLVRTAADVPTWCVVAEDAPADRCQALRDAGVNVLTAARAGEGLDLREVLTVVGRGDVVDLLVEGGSRIAGALVEANLVDELWWFVAPIVLGAEGEPALRGPRPLDPSALPRGLTKALEQVGSDVLWIVRPS